MRHRGFLVLDGRKIVRGEDEETCPNPRFSVRLLQRRLHARRALPRPSAVAEVLSVFQVP